MPAKLIREGEVLRLTLAGMSRADFGEALQRAKAIPGRRWNPEQKVWEFPAELQVAERIMHTIKPVPSAEVMKWVRQSRADRSDELATSLPEDSNRKLLIGWADKLYPYQRAAVEFMVDNPSCLLADDMGLGKTLQSLTAVCEYAEGDDLLSERPRLIICPNSVKGSWAREVEKWTGLPAFVIDGKTAETELMALVHHVHPRESGANDDDID